MQVIHVSERLIEAVIQHSQSESPREACGILAGEMTQNEVRISKVYRCQNVHPNPTVEYLIKPEDQLRVFQRIDEDEGLDLVGFYHSHPKGSNLPSSADSSRNYWPGYIFAIVSLQPSPEVSFWSWKNDRFSPEKVIRERF